MTVAIEKEKKVKHFRPLVLGVPVDEMHTPEVIAQVEEWIDAPSEKKKSHFVVLFNHDLIRKTMGWHPFAHTHPEMIKILRHADMVLPEVGSFLWSVFTMGRKKTHLPSYRYLLLHLLERLNKEGRKLMILSHNPSSLEHLRGVIHFRFPNLSMATYVKPALIVSGEALVEAHETDREIAKELNQFNPDVLLLALDHPEQEIWYTRVQEQLSVPVTIGIGNLERAIKDDVFGPRKTLTQAFLAKSKRFLHNPIKESAKYAHHLFKIPYIAFPVAAVQNLGFGLPRKRKPFVPSLLFHHSLKAEGKSLSIYTLPIKMNEKEAKALHALFLHMPEEEIHIFDWQQVAKLDPVGLSALMEIWLTLMKAGKEVFSVDLPPFVKRLMQWHRVWDFFGPRSYASKVELYHRINSIPEVSHLLWSVVQKSPFTVVSFFGELDTRLDKTDAYQEIVEKSVGDRVILDFSWCGYIDSSGIGFLLRLRKHFMQLRKPLIFTGLNKSVHQTLKISKVESLFQIIPTLSKVR